MLKRVLRGKYPMVCMFFMLLSLSVFAEQTAVGFRIVPTDDVTKVFRYQLNGQQDDGWTIVGYSEAVLEFDLTDGLSSILYVQKSSDEIHWSDSFRYQYDPVGKVWSVLRGAMWIDSLDIAFSGMLPMGRYSEFFGYGLGGEVRVNLAFSEYERLVAFGALSYRYGASKTALVDAFHDLDATVGIGYRFSLGKKLELIPELGYGIANHLLYGDVYGGGTSGLSYFLDQQVQLGARLVLTISDQVGVYIAPTGLLFIEQGEIGVLLGCGAGIRLFL